MTSTSEGNDAEGHPLYCVPVVGIDVDEWNELIRYGLRRGELSTIEIVDALHHVELLPENIDAIRADIEAHHIKVDQSFEIDDSGELCRSYEKSQLGHSLQRNSRQSAPRLISQVDQDTSTDIVKLYFQEISRIDLLDAEEEKFLGRRISEGLAAATHLQEIAASVSTLERRRLQRVIDNGARAREDLTQANLRLVVSIAKRFSKTSMPLADAIQSGNIGLIRAVDRFDYTRGFKFSTYATWWIKQAISRAISEEGRNIRIPAHAMENINRALRVQRELTQRYQREVTLVEVATALGETIERVAEYFSLAADTTSLDRSTSDDNKSTLADKLLAIDTVDPSNGIQIEDIRQLLSGVLQDLPEREREVMKMRFGLDGQEPATLEEVGLAFDITRERVRQIEVRSLVHLRHMAGIKTLRKLLND